MADRPPDDYSSAPTLTITLSLLITQLSNENLQLRRGGSWSRDGDARKTRIGESLYDTSDQAPKSTYFFLLKNLSSEGLGKICFIVRCENSDFTAFGNIFDFIKFHESSICIFHKFCYIGILPVWLISHTDPKQPQHTHCNGIVLLSKSSSSRYSSPSSETKDDPWLVYNHIRNGARSPFINQWNLLSK